MRRDTSHVADIINAARRVRAYLQNVDKLEFDEDRMVQNAVIRQLLIIGEATKRLTAEFRAAHPNVPWHDMAAMRDILVHAYDRVDLGEVWRVAKEDLSGLIERLEPLLPPPPK
jgi:uncharacterized protein with HEPN domain